MKLVQKPGLYRKLETFTADRNRLQSKQQSLTGVQARQRRGDDAAEIERAIDALRNLGKALSKARPQHRKELFASIVSRIELHFKPGTGRYNETFRAAHLLATERRRVGRIRVAGYSNMYKQIPSRTVRDQESEKKLRKREGPRALARSGCAVLEADLRRG